MSSTTAESGSHTATRGTDGSPGLMLALATIGFAVNFWA